MSEPPILTPNGLRLSVKQEKRRVLGVFGGGNNTKVVQLGSVEQAHVSHHPANMHGRTHSSTLHSPLPQHPGRDPQHPGRDPQPPSRDPQSPSRGFLFKRPTGQTAPPAPRKGLFGVVGSIGSGITKMGRDVAEGVSKAATGRPLTADHSRQRTSVPPGNAGYGSSVRPRPPPPVAQSVPRYGGVRPRAPPPVAQSVPTSESPLVSIEWENVIIHVQVPKEDPEMQVFYIQFDIQVYSVWASAKILKWPFKGLAVWSKAEDFHSIENFFSGD